MSRDTAPTGEQQITTDRETIRRWVEDRGGRPARESGADRADAESLIIVREGEENGGGISWDEFFETFESENMAFVYQDLDEGDTQEWVYDLIDREEIVERSAEENAAVEEALLAGEVVRSEITETTVIEREIVETDRIESKVVDSEIVRDEVVDRELVRREILGGSFPELGTEEAEGRRVPEPTETDVENVHDAESGARTAAEAEETDAEGRERFAAEAGESIEATDDDTVELEVEETVRTTREVLERKTVESRVVDREVTERDTVESDQIETRSIDVSGVERSILEGDLIEGDIVGRGIDEESEDVGLQLTDAITSERGDEEGVVLSRFVERRVVEDEATERRRLRCRVVESELLDSDTLRSEVLEREIIDDADADIGGGVDESTGREAVDATEAGEPTPGEVPATERAGDEPASDEPMAEDSLAADEPIAPSDESTSEYESTRDDTDAADSAPAEPGAIEITDDEIGKDVVSGDRDIGIVADIEGETLYVDPHPSLTDRIKAALDWGGRDEDTYPVTKHQVRRVTDDEIEIEDPESSSRADEP
ncbi:hypothetical protein ACNS7O_02210 [Haloferacaceae archaeon DSL9]